jgi:hypothetical protein
MADQPLDEIQFDYDTLRLLVNRKRFQMFGKARGHGIAQTARVLGVADTTLGKFLRGEDRKPELRAVMRMMLWVGYTDVKEFVA